MNLMPFLVHLSGCSAPIRLQCTYPRAPSNYKEGRLGTRQFGAIVPRNCVSDHELVLLLERNSSLPSPPPPRSLIKDQIKLGLHLGLDVESLTLG